jgi:hypothetical protein
LSSWLFFSSFIKRTTSTRSMNWGHSNCAFMKQHLMWINQNARDSTKTKKKHEKNFSPVVRWILSSHKNRSWQYQIWRNDRHFAIMIDLRWCLIGRRKHPWSHCHHNAPKSAGNFQSTEQKWRESPSTR